MNEEKSEIKEEIKQEIPEEIKGVKKEKPDIKMIVGMILLTAILVTMGGFFWKTVGEQAELVKEEERREEENAITAVYVEIGDFLKRPYFVDRNGGGAFIAPIPQNGIYNKQGRLIEDDVLESGDIVKIYGDGAMAESYPGRYPRVTKMQRAGRVSLEELTEIQEKLEAELSDI